MGGMQLCVLSSSIDDIAFKNPNLDRIGDFVQPKRGVHRLSRWDGFIGLLQLLEALGPALDRGLHRCDEFTHGERII